MDSYREQGRDALKTVLKQQKNIETIERNIFNKIKSSSDPQKEYKIVIFQVIGDIHNGVELKEILGSIKNNKVGWNHDSYNEMANKIVEQNEFIRNPFEVEEGVFQCKACGSKRVYSYARQDRSCDEGTSVYAQCVACKAKWRERG
jgi:DNA-directed RNA polymerase subunit M/transcription elongation factor TFIIS